MTAPVVPSRTTDQPTMGAEPPQWLYDYIQKAQANKEDPAVISKTVAAYGYQELANQVMATPGQGADGGNGLLEQLGLAVGRTGRAITTGLESLVRMPSNLVAAGGGLLLNKTAGPGAAAAFQQIAQQNMGAGPPVVADQLGLPEYAPGAQTVLGRAAEGAVAGAPFGGVGALAGAMGGGASETAAQMGAGPGGQMVAGLAGGVVVPTFMAGTAGAIRQALAGSAAKRAAARESQSILNAAAGGDVATLGQITKGGAGATIQGALRNLPGAGQRLGAAFERQTEGLAQQAERIGTRLSPRGSPTTAGRAIQRGIEEGFLPTFRAQSKQLYDRAFRLVPENAPVVPLRTRLLFNEINASPSASQVFSGLDNPQIRTWADELANALDQNPQGIPFAVIKDFRSRLGEMLSGADLVDAPLRDIKRLYGAVSDDMQGAIAQHGGREGLQAWQRASKYWKAGSDRIENVLQPIVDKRTPELAFNAIMSGSKEGATILRSTLRSLGPSERRLVAATVLKNIGKASPGAQDAAGSVFSPERFLTNWSRFAPEARSALFEGIDPRVTQDLNQLAKAAEIIKSSSKVMANPSGTAQNNAFWAIVSGIGTGAMFGGVKGAATGAAVGGGPYLAARMFTSPKMVHWLVGTTKMPYGALMGQLPRLAKEAQAWSAEDRDIANDFVRHMSNIDWPMMITVKALTDATTTSRPAASPAP